MARLLKVFLFLLIALVVLVATTVFVLTRIIDPNDFKDDIAVLAKEHANVDLVIDGNISWSFWPSLALDVGRTEARIAGEEELFAGIDSLQVGVALKPLFARRVEMDAIKLDGMELNLVNSQQGGNWEALLPDQKKVAEAQEADEKASLDVPVAIPSVAITNSKLRYRDLTAGTDIRIDNLALEAKDVSLTEDFPITVALRYQDQDDMRIRLNANTRLHTDVNAERYTLAPLAMQIELAGLTAQPIKLDVDAGVLADLAADTLTLSDLTLRALGTETRGQITVNNMTQKLALTGNINTAPFDANKLLQALGEEAMVTADKKALSKVSIDATFSGPANTVQLNPLTVKLDDSTFTGSAGITNLDTMAIAFDLNLDAITLDRYLPPSSEKASGSAGSSAPLSGEPILPLELLRGLNVKGKLDIGQLELDTIKVNNAKNALTLTNGKLNLNNSGSLFDGSYRANTDINASSSTPTLRSQINTDSLQIQRLIIMALDRDLLTGLVNLDATLTTKGNSEKEWFENLNGKLDFGLLDAVTHGLNLNTSVIDGINDMVARVPGLSDIISSLDESKLPQELRGDTKILDLLANTRLENGVVHVDKMTAELARGGGLNGKGWLNLLNDEFKFDFNLSVGDYVNNKHLTERDWPIHCEGKLTGNPATWCFPDKSLFQEAGRHLLQQLAKEKLGLDEARLAEEKAKLDARAAEEKEKLEARAEEEQLKLQERTQKEADKLKEKARDKLKGLF